MNELDQHELQTPNGNPVKFLFRRGTNDHNVMHSCCTFDEYGLKDLELSGWALDLGAYLGGVGVALAVDHPDLCVFCVEPVPDNAELIRQHATMNNVEERVTVLEAAAGKPDTTTQVRYGFRSDADGEYDHHAWVGNASMVYADPPVEAHDTIEVPCLDLLDFFDGLLSLDPPALIKIDCEGGEWDALEQLVALGSPHVVGEWHPVCGRTGASELIWAFAAAGYDVGLTGPINGPGGFTAMIHVKDKPTEAQIKAVLGDDGLALAGVAAELTKKLAAGVPEGFSLRIEVERRGLDHDEARMSVGRRSGDMRDGEVDFTLRHDGEQLELYPIAVNPGICW